MDGLIQIPRSDWHQFKRLVKIVDWNLTVWIDDEEACALLGRKNKPLAKGTLSNMISHGIIPKKCYTTMVNGRQKFNKHKLMGLQ